VIDSAAVSGTRSSSMFFEPALDFAANGGNR
jgi:hypothetical protein